VHRHGGLPATLLVAGLIAANLQPLLGQPSLKFEASKELRTGYEFHGAYFLPRWWSEMGLVAVDYNRSVEPVICVVRNDGSREDVRFRMEDAGSIGVYGAAGGSDGALAVIGYAITSVYWHEFFLAWIWPDRRQQNVTRLSPYVPQAVAIAADGAVWTAGLVNVNDNIPDHQVIRRFDRSGKMLGAFFPWSRPRAHPAASSYLLASPDRVGWYFPMGKGYVEFSLQGKILGQFRGLEKDDRQRITGAALSEDNKLVVSRRDYEARKWEAFTLDRVTRSWTPVQVPSGSGQGRRVLGFDGEDLLSCIDYDVISYYKPCKEKGAER
jgi:hypothetical protein